VEQPNQTLFDKEDAWLFDLAIFLRLPIGQLLEDMPEPELRVWQEYLASEPRGDRRGDWQSAQLAKALHDIALGFNGKSNPMALDQYLLKFESVDPAELTRRNLQAARAIFGKVVPTL